MINLQDEYQVALLSVAQFLIIILLFLTHKYTINYRRITRLAQRMHSIPRSKVANAANQYVEIEGVSFCPQGRTVISPISGDECLFWSVRIVDAKTRHIKKVIHSQNPFFIKDETGRALLCPGRYTEIQLGVDHTTEHQLTKEFLATNQAFLVQLKMEPVDFLNAHLEEITIPLHSSIYATGHMVRSPGANHSRVAKALKSADLPQATALLQRLGYEAEFEGKHPQYRLSVTGEHLPQLGKPAKIYVQEPKEGESAAFYLYGMPDKPLFISVITETMIDDKQHLVRLYRSHPLTEEIIFLSCIFMLLMLYHAM